MTLFSQRRKISFTIVIPTNYPIDRIYTPQCLRVVNLDPLFYHPSSPRRSTSSSLSESEASNPPSAALKPTPCSTRSVWTHRSCDAWKSQSSVHHLAGDTMTSHTVTMTRISHVIVTFPRDESHFPCDAEWSNSCSCGTLNSVAEPFQKISRLRIWNTKSGLLRGERHEHCVREYCCPEKWLSNGKQGSHCFSSYTYSAFTWLCIGRSSIERRRVIFSSCCLELPWVHGFWEHGCPSQKRMVVWYDFCQIVRTGGLNVVDNHMKRGAQGLVASRTGI